MAASDSSEALSIGMILGGSTPENRRWDEALTLLTIEAEAVCPEEVSGIHLNVEFHVPGDILQPEFEGVRTGSFRKADQLLMVHNDAELLKSAIVEFGKFPR